MDCITFCQHYIQEKQEMQQILLNYIDDEDNIEEYYQNLCSYIKEKNLVEDKSELKIFLNLLTRISNYHFRKSDFFNKIEKIILDFKEDILKQMTNSEIFNIFQSNKRILLFLFEKKIIIFNQYIYLKIYEEDDYLIYFYPEISDYCKNNKPEPVKSSNYKMKPLIELINSNIEDFKSKRKVGENDTYICQLIRNDDIDNFISYVNKNNIKINSYIQNSIFDTNKIIFEANQNNDSVKVPSLIEYACFFGSIQIFKYLYQNNAEIKMTIWLYAIHGRHPEIIHMIEEHDFSNDYRYHISYDKILIKSIKYFHNEIANYILQNYFLNEPERNSYIYSSITQHAIKYHNFDFIFLKNNVNSFLRDFCEYGFTSLVNYLVEETDAIQSLNADLQYLEKISSLLYNIIKNEHFEIMKKLFEKKLIDVNDVFYYVNKKIMMEQKFNLLFFAVSKNNYEMAQFLISQPNININFQYTFRYYIMDSQISEIEDIEDDPKAFWDWNNDSLDIGEENKYCDFNSPSFYSPFEKTVLQVAVEYKNKKIIELLINHPNINVNCEMIIKINDISDEHYRSFHMFKEKTIQINQTPLLTAIENEDLEAVNLLLSHPKIDVNLKSTKDIRYKYIFYNISNKEKNNFSKFLHERKTPLCAAIITKNFDLVKLLLSNDNIEINAQSIIINNFPHFFIKKENMSTVLEDPLITLKNISEMTDQSTEEITDPFKLAIGQNNNDILNLLNSKKDK